MSYLLSAVRDYLLDEDPDAISDETLLKLISLFTWSSMYILVSMNTRKEAEWCNRTMSLLHGFLTAVFGIWQCGMTSLTFERLHEPIRCQHYFLMLLSWGYFAYDLIWCIIYWTESALMLAHHVSALLFITRFMHKKVGGCIFGCAIGALEITNPCLQIRWYNIWFLREAKYDKSVLYVVIELTYLLSFMVVRGVVGTVVMLRALGTDLDPEVKVMGLILWGVSIGFIYDIYCFIRKNWQRRMAVVTDTFTNKSPAISQ